MHDLIRIPIAQVLGAAVLLTSFGIGCGPIGPFAGGHLSGTDASWPPNWEAVADEPEAQLETRLDDPYSINIWFVVVDDEAYLASSLLYGPEVPDEREWVQNVDADPRVRIRINDRVYPALIESLDDPSLEGHVLEAFRAKYEKLDPVRVRGARFFRLVGTGQSGA